MVKIRHSHETYDAHLAEYVAIPQSNKRLC